MKKLIPIILFGCLVSLTGVRMFPQEPGEKNSCVECHRELDEELKAPAVLFPEDIHAKFGLDCSSCHGGNPREEDIDAAKDASFRPRPDRREIPEFCGACHSDFDFMRKYKPDIRVDQLDLYWTSYHGKALRKGDLQAAVCTDCHGIHGIREATHPKSWVFPWNIPDTCGRCHSKPDIMDSYGIPTSQQEDYKGSVHARALYEKKDLSAPVCNDCHGNHGAAPPEVTSIAFVCRQCHPSPSELFGKSPHKTAYDELGISECEACHGNHKILPPSDEMLGTGEGAVCIECHDEDSEAFRVAAEIKKRLDEFKARLEKAENMLEQADSQGVEVSEPKFRLQEARTALVQVRNLTHSFSLEEIEKKLEEGNTVLELVLTSGDAALKEAQFRKRGLIVATVFIFLLALALLMKIRQINRETST